MFAPARSRMRLTSASAVGQSVARAESNTNIASYVFTIHSSTHLAQPPLAVKARRLSVRKSILLIQSIRLIHRGGNAAAHPKFHGRGRTLDHLFRLVPLALGERRQDERRQVAAFRPADAEAQSRH